MQARHRDLRRGSANQTVTYLPWNVDGIGPKSQGSLHLRLMPFRVCLFLFLSTLVSLTAAPVLETLAALEQPGVQPMTPLLYVASDGNYYGTTSEGGTSNKGTAFRMSPGGLITTLVSFTGENCSAPGANLSG